MTVSILETFLDSFMENEELVFVCQSDVTGGTVLVQLVGSGSTVITTDRKVREVLNALNPQLLSCMNELNVSRSESEHLPNCVNVNETGSRRNKGPFTASSLKQTSFFSHLSFSMNNQLTGNGLASWRSTR